MCGYFPQMSSITLAMYHYYKSKRAPKAVITVIKSVRPLMKHISNQKLHDITSFLMTE